MATIKTNTNVNFNVLLTLTEVEARALDALAGYEINSFLEMFYQNMGKAYLEKYEDGLISLFASVRECLPHQLMEIDDARNKFNKIKVK